MARHPLIPRRRGRPLLGLLLGLLFGCALPAASLAAPRGDERARGRVVLATVEGEAVLERYLDRRAGGAVLWIELGPADAAPLHPGARRLGSGRGGGEDRRLAGAIAGADAVALVGGRFSEWFETLTPGRHRSRVGLALAAALRRGADVAGVGAAAAFLAGASLVPADEPLPPLRDRHEQGRARIVVGLGLERHWFADVGGGSGPETLRLARSLFDLGADEGLWLGPGGAAAIGRDGNLEVLAGPVAILSLEGARRNRDAVRGARLSLLARGDLWSRDRGVPRFAEGTATVGTPSAALAPTAGRASRVESDADLLEALVGLAAGIRAAPLPLETPGGSLAVRLDEVARRLSGPSGARLSAARIDLSDLRR